MRSSVSVRESPVLEVRDVRPQLRRYTVWTLILLTGIGLGRFVVPLLEWRNETTAIFLTTKGRCGYSLSTTEYFLGQPRTLIDGGDTVQCGDRKPLSRDAFIACEC